MKSRSHVSNYRWWFFHGCALFFQTCHLFDSIWINLVLAFLGIVFGLFAIILSEIVGQSDSKRIVFDGGEMLVIDVEEEDE